MSTLPSEHKSNSFWPNPLGQPAFLGPVGDIVRTIEPHTEADPAALLVQLLVALGNVIGRGVHFKAESTRHGLNLFAVLVGITSKGRKGSSWGHITRLLASCDPEWIGQRVQSGLSSGEGLIHAARDGGNTDKRLLVIESEFASTLRVLGRDGNTLSPTMRQAWDGDKLQVMTKQFPETASNAHISVVGHVTKDELRRELTRTDMGNGFANRILWTCVKRSKTLPEGGQVPAEAFGRLSEGVIGILEFASSLGEHELRRDAAARELWHGIYPELSEGKPGLFGAVTSRAEAQVMRIACVYAILNLSSEIREEHLQAAVAVWKYCEASARFVFGGSLGDPLADEILGLLRNAPQGLTRTELSNSFGRNRSGLQLGTALAMLAEHGLATLQMEQTGGRSAERWFAKTSGLNSSPSSNSSVVSPPSEAVAIEGGERSVPTAAPSTTELRI